jgi:hypothetical protein
MASDLPNDHVSPSPLPNLIPYQELLSSSSLEREHEYERPRDILSVRIPSWVLLPHLGSEVKNHYTKALGNHTSSQQTSVSGHGDQSRCSLTQDKSIPTKSRNKSSDYDYAQSEEEEVNDYVTDFTEFNMITDADG